MPDVSPAAIKSAFQFHDKLDPKVWDGLTMRPEVRLRLLKAAKAFYEFLAMPDLRLTDVHLTGSNAAYNYTPVSDLDVHLVVDFSKTVCPTLADNLFTTKKALWTQTYEVSVHDVPVELYVEDASKPATSNGVFSILRDEWIREPKRARPPHNDSAVETKVQAYVAQIEGILAATPEASQIDDFFARMKRLRQSGLMDGGEYSTENMTYKALRALGYLDELWAARAKAINRSLSLESVRSRP